MFSSERGLLKLGVKILILTFIRAIVTEEGSCAPEISYVCSIVFIIFYLKEEICYAFIVELL